MSTARRVVALRSLLPLSYFFCVSAGRRCSLLSTGRSQSSIQALCPPILCHFICSQCPRFFSAQDLVFCDTSEQPILKKRQETRDGHHPETPVHQAHHTLPSAALILTWPSLDACSFWARRGDLTRKCICSRTLPTLPGGNTGRVFPGCDFGTQRSLSCSP